MKRFPATKPWVALEVLAPDSDGNLDPDTGPRPVWDELCKSGLPDIRALGRMHLMLQHGWPQAKHRMFGGSGKVLITQPDDKKPEVWLLKCKPSGWRIYFYVYSQESDDGERRILFLHAVDKDGWDEDDQDVEKARSNFERARAGTFGAVYFEFPDTERL